MMNLEKDTGSYIKSIKDLIKKKKFKRAGRLVWDCTKLGTFKRPWKKIGRNDICPCGRMRDLPRDITKQMKYKFCCGRNSL